MCIWREQKKCWIFPRDVATSTRPHRPTHLNSNWSVCCCYCVIRTILRLSKINGRHCMCHWTRTTCVQVNFLHSHTALMRWDMASLFSVYYWTQLSIPENYSNFMPTSYCKAILKQSPFWHVFISLISFAVIFPHFIICTRVFSSL